jgi:hypothetical protein
LNLEGLRETINMTELFSLPKDFWLQEVTSSNQIHSNGLKHVAHRFILYGPFIDIIPILECSPAQCQRIFYPKFFSLWTWSLRRICYTCTIMYNMYQQSNSNTTKF